MRRTHLEFWVGLFLLLGILCLGYLSIRVARRELFHRRGYEVQAVFDNCNGLRAGCPVVLAGVEVGRVKKIRLQDYEARVSLSIEPGLVLQKDVIASIRTSGLIGEKFVELTPGSAAECIPPGGVIRNTEPALDLEGLIAKLVHGTVPAH